MIRKDLSIEEILARHKNGEQVFIANPAAFPSETFPIGSSHPIRLYKGRTQTNWGTVIATTNAKVTDKGLTILGFKIEKAVNPATGKVLPVKFSVWIVRPDGIEQYTGYRGDVAANEPPSLSSLLTTGEDYTN